MARIEAGDRRGRRAFLRRALRIEALEPRIALASQEIGQEFRATFDCAATSLIEGVALRLDLRTYVEGGEKLCALLVDWGDGSAPTECGSGVGPFYLGHIYAPVKEETIYTIAAIIVSDAAGEAGEAGESYELATFAPLVESSNFLSTTICDAEKGDVSESELCWAAGAANALWSSGWGRIVGGVDAGGAEATFESEDDLYEYFAAYFENGASSAYYAIEWFFTGEYALEGYVGAAQPLLEGGGFYVDVDLTEVLGYYSYSTSSEADFSASDALELLRSGYGVLASLGYRSLDSGALVGAHTISVWGFHADASFEIRSSDFYRALIVTDSDDDAYLGREAPNRTREIPILWDEARRRLALVGYRSDVESLVEEWIALAPRTFDFDLGASDAAFALWMEEDVWE